MGSVLDLSVSDLGNEEPDTLVEEPDYEWTLAVNR